LDSPGRAQAVAGQLADEHKAQTAGSSEGRMMLFQKRSIRGRFRAVQTKASLPCISLLQ
jgi:hypothetical protein